MILQNLQDDAIVSDRNNDQDLFHGNSNSQDIYSENSNDSEDDIGYDYDQQGEVIRYDEQTLLKLNDNLIKDDKSKKEVKATCMGKAQGYMGFGNQFNNQKIGNIFFIPIPSEWTFKWQVIAIQIITTIIALGIFGIFSDTLLRTNQNLMSAWLNDHYDELSGQLLQEINDSLELLLNETIEEELLLIQQTSQMMDRQQNFPQINLTWPHNKTISINGKINHDASVNNVSDYEDYYSSITYEFGTYYLKDQSLNDSQINKFMNINHMLAFQFQGNLSITNRIYWNFNHQFIMVYPGIIVKNSTQFIAIVENNFDTFLNAILTSSMSSNISIPVQINPLNNKYCAYVATSLKANDGKSNIGLAYTEISIDKIQSLYHKVIGGINETLIFIVLNETNFILNDAFDQIGTQFQSSQVLMIKVGIRNDVQNFISKENHKQNNLTYFKFRTLDDKLYTQQSFLYPQFGLKFIIRLLDNYKLVARQNALAEQYLILRNNFRNNYLPILLCIPILIILISMFFLVKWMKPVKQITKVKTYNIKLAYLSLKKNQKLNQEEIDQINGDGLINQFIILFKTLIGSLNAMKQDNKKQLCNYYSQQTYPKKINIKELQKIKDQVEQIKNLTGSDMSLGAFVKKQRYFRLLPSYDE